ncbi:facilitated trehalose transporter Tret1 [Daphnia magna]|uniref:facilitated trehalose transporter Tret1 n=1 Tax=Daphnia magna TaxID=35525 RepID=UPI001E1BBEA3|nr:facilitated trehalose transporter Tret1 [Daphnia magna]
MVKQSLMKNPHKVLPQLMAAVVGSWGYFCMGTSRGWGSPGLPSLNRTLDFEMDADDFKWISAVPMCGSFFGALVVSIPMQYFGRKKALVGHYLLYIFGFLTVGLTCFGKHKAMLYVGRILQGLAVGCTTPACQIYVSECSSPNIRGRLGSITASSLALGIWVAYIIGAFVEWDTLSFIFSALPVVFLLLTCFMPETPIWLLTHGMEDEGRQALQQLRGKNTNVDAEMRRMKEHHEKTDSGKGSVRFADLMTAPVLKPFGISLGIMFFQQATGINAMVFYTVSIFQSAGSSIESRYATIIVGGVQLVFTIASGFLVDRYGRRILLLSSAAVTSISLTSMGTFFYFQRIWGEATATELLGWVPLVSLIVFFVAYSGGMSNVPLIIMGEMFPSQYRTMLGTLSSSFNLFVTLAIVRFFPDMLIQLGNDVTFFIFAGCTVTSIAFVYFLLPETKGKTLEEIEEIFSNVKKNDKKAEVEQAAPATVSTQFTNIFGNQCGLVCHTMLPPVGEKDVERGITF